MRYYAGSRLRLAHNFPVYVGISGRLSFFQSFWFAVGFLLFFVLMARWLR
jgi:hypothetical protein